MISASEVDRRVYSDLTADVIVVGGGAAGVAAAVAAAQNDVRVLLIERYGFCGGGAVAGMSGTICGLYAANEHSRAPELIASGLAMEFVCELERAGGLAPPARYGHTWTRAHDPHCWREAADRLLGAAGVQVIFHAVATAVLIDHDGAICGVCIATKRGAVRATASVVIDATGDADIVAMAGAKLLVDGGPGVQNPTMMFRILGVDVARFRAAWGGDSISPQWVMDLLRHASSQGVEFPRLKIFLFETPRPGELLCNATRIANVGGSPVDPLDPMQLSYCEQRGRKQVRQYLRFFQQHVPGCEEAFLNDTGVQVGVRQSRQALGRRVLRNTDVSTAMKSATGIARSAWPIELHNGEKPYLSWLFDDYYEVPFECLIPAEARGLLVAGRCLSAESEAMASARVTAQCFAYGEAAGIAAGVAVREKIEVTDISGDCVRDELRGLYGCW